MNKIKLTLIFLFSMVISACAQNDSIRTIDADEFERAIQSDSVQVVDVRTAEEYVAGHIPNAINIDVLQDHFKEKAKAALIKGKTIAVYCRSGKRSMKAANLLAQEGKKVINLRGGWIEWTEKKKPIGTSHTH